MSSDVQMNDRLEPGGLIVLIPSNRVMSSDLFRDVRVLERIIGLNPLKSGHVFGSTHLWIGWSSGGCLNPLKSGHVFGSTTL